MYKKAHRCIYDNNNSNKIKINNDEMSELHIVFDQIYVIKCKCHFEFMIHRTFGYIFSFVAAALLC